MNPQSFGSATILFWININQQLHIALKSPSTIQNSFANLLLEHIYLIYLNRNRFLRSCNKQIVAPRTLALSCTNPTSYPICVRRRRTLAILQIDNLGIYGFGKNISSHLPSLWQPSKCLVSTQHFVTTAGRNKSDNTITMNNEEDENYTPRADRQDQIGLAYYGLYSIASSLEPQGDAADATPAKLTDPCRSPISLPVPLLSLPMPELRSQAHQTIEGTISPSPSNPYAGVSPLHSPVLTQLPYITLGPPLVTSNLEYWVANYIYTSAFDGDYFIARQLV
jgi:hypothetical protein